MSDLTSSYRPKRWEDVIGQTALVSSLRKSIERASKKAFILAGPSGVGKTTLARIGARELGAEPANIREVDAATHGGVDDMRALTDTLKYRAFGKKPHIAVVLDECHTLSKQAWDALLKSVEEPPEHVSWWFCTTDPRKIPTTIKTRCGFFNLKEVGENDLGVLYARVCKAEGISLSTEVAQVIIRQAEGSPRQMLANLEKCRDVKTRKRAQELCEEAQQSAEAVDLARFLIRGGGSWKACMALLGKFPEGHNPESTRIVLMAYFGAVLKNAKSDGEACKLLALMEHFCSPYNPVEKLSPLLLSLGRALYAAG